MKDRAYVIMMGAIALLLGGSAWLWKNGYISFGNGSGIETDGVVFIEKSPEAFEGYDLVQAFGTFYDEELGQWSGQDCVCLASRSHAPVKAVRSGKVVDVCETNEGYTVQIEDDAGYVVSYAGLNGGLGKDSRVSEGETIGFLKDDTLKVTVRKDDLILNPEEFIHLSAGKSDETVE